MNEKKQFTPEEVYDIKEMYREAKYPKAQVGVMAQLYVCSIKDILRALELQCEPAPDSSARRGYAKYGAETKQAVLTAVLDKGEAPKEVSERLEVKPTSVHTWLTKERQRRAAVQAVPLQEASACGPEAAPLRTIRFVMKSGAVLDVRCTAFEMKKGADGKFERYWFSGTEGRPPLYICHYEVAAVLELPPEEVRV